MAAFLDTTSNFSLYTVPIAWVVAILPHAYAASQSKKFDNVCPREYNEALNADQTIDQATKARIMRAEAAQMNGFENLAFFASAVVAGNLAGLPATTLNMLSGGYIVSRILYNLIYINNTSQAMANTRSVVFASGVGMILTLFIKSGNVLKDRAANPL